MPSKINEKEDWIVPLKCCLSQYVKDKLPNVCWKVLYKKLPKTDSKINHTTDIKCQGRKSLNQTFAKSYFYKTYGPAISIFN